MDQLLLFYCFVLYISLTVRASSDLEVSTQFGTLKGDDRGWYTAFEGIPYAEPPINDRRFEPPVPFQSSVRGIYSSETNLPEFEMLSILFSSGKVFVMQPSREIRACNGATSF